MTYPEYLHLTTDLSDAEHVAIVENAIKEHPEDKWILKTILANKCFTSPQEHEKCISVCEEIISDCKDKELLTWAYYYTAILFRFDRKDANESLRRYRKVIELDPNVDVFFNQIIELLIEQKDFAEARRYADMLCNIAESESYGFEQIGNIYLEQKEWSKAIEFYLKAEDCKNEYNERSSPLYFAGFCCDELQEYDKAIEIFKSAIEKYGEEDQIYHAIGICWQKKGDYYRSLDNYMKALKLNPKMHIVYNNIAALIHEHEHDAIKVEEYLLKALEGNYDSNKESLTLIYQNLFKFNKARLDHDKADYYFRKFLEVQGLDGLLDFSDEG